MIEWCKKTHARKLNRKKRRISRVVEVTDSNHHIIPVHRIPWTPTVSIPYYVPISELPARLPVREEIEQSQEILHERTAAKVVAVGPHFVAKYGKHISLEEGRTMKFVAENTKVPVPHIYALYCDSGINYIVMERIQGKTLREAWHDFSVVQKLAIATQIKRHLLELRQIPAPWGYCSLDNKPLRDQLFWTGRGDASLGCDGPFDSILDLIGGLIAKCKASEILKGKARFYETALPSIFDNTTPVFTHGDLQEKNIMIRAQSPTDETIVFLDWEIAGWYPAFWEYAQTMCGCGIFEDDWHEWVHKFLEPFLSEYAWLSMLELEMGY